MSNSYWQIRDTEAMSAATTKSIKETEKQLRKYYKDCMYRVQDEFSYTYSHILRTLGANQEITPADLYKLDKYWQTNAYVRDELQKLGDKTAKSLSNQFTRHYQKVYDDLAIADKTGFNRISEETAQQMINKIWCADGKSWSERVWKNTARLQSELNDTLIHCVVTGARGGELAKELSRRFGVSFDRASTLVRTELAHIQTEAARDRYRDYGIEEVEILVDEDEQTCEECAQLEGQRFNINGVMPVPVHPRCRCCIVPVISFDRF